MYAGDNDRKTVDESYAGAVSSSSLRVGNDPAVRTAGDMIAAAGMNQFRMGLALNRLMTEWNNGATPAPVQVPDLEPLVRQAAQERWAKAPFVCLHIVHQVDRAEAEARRRAAIEKYAKWEEHEHKLRLQRLKTLPAVRDALLFWVREKGWDGDVHLVAAVIQRFLSPRCHHCNGTGTIVLGGAFGRAGSRRCSECRKKGREPGEAAIPHGGRGRALLEYMNTCVGRSGFELKQGAHRLWRTARNEQARGEQRERERQERELRVQREAEADAKQNTAAVAERFKDSMGRTRPKG